MHYNPHLSNILDHDVYVMNNGVIYIQVRGNQYHIGTTGSTVAELRLNMEKYI